MQTHHKLALALLEAMIAKNCVIAVSAARREDTATLDRALHDGVWLEKQEAMIREICA